MQEKFRVKSTTEINDLVDKWHEGKGKISLAEFLGFSEAQYELSISDFELFCKKYNIIDDDKQEDAS